MKQIIVTYLINDKQEKQLEDLLPYWQNTMLAGKKPFENWTTERLFQTIMETGCCYDIDMRLAVEKSRQEDLKDVMK